MQEEMKQKENSLRSKFQSSFNRYLIIEAEAPSCEWRLLYLLPALSFFPSLFLKKYMNRGQGQAKEHLLLASILAPNRTQSLGQQVGVHKKPNLFRLTAILLGAPSFKFLCPVLWLWW